MLKQVICDGKLFAVDQSGRRVWLSAPPAWLLEEIEYDRRRAQSWQQLQQEDCEE